MEQQYTKEDILKAISQIEFGAVSTMDGTDVKSRAMHFAVDSDFNIYLSSIKSDPKINQMLENAKINILLINGVEGFEKAKETEIVGEPVILSDKEDREKALELLCKKSPIVSNLTQANATDILAVIKVIPRTIKFRVVEEIIRGVPPTVIDFSGSGVVSKHSYRPWETFKQRLGSWMVEMRLPFLTASVIPVILGSVIAWSSTLEFNYFYFILALLGGVCLHLGTNIANDYFDHISGNDDSNTEYVRPFSGGSRMIQEKKLSPAEVLIGSLIFFGIGSLIGLYFVSVLGIQILILGVIGVFSGFFYSAPPFKLASRGLGELVVGLNFGILMAMGAYFVQTKIWSTEVLIAALPVSFLIAAVLYINEFPDLTADKSAGKNTLVVRLDKERAVKGYEIIMWMTYIVLAAAIIFRFISPFAALGFLTFPRAMRAVRVAKQNFGKTIYLIPANADTVMVHLYTGILISAGYLMQGVITKFF